jgi:phosphoribosylformylglycinamidine synthase
MERDGLDLTAAMFSESQARAIVSVGREDDVKFVSLCEARGVPVVRIGVTDLESSALEIQNVADIDLLELKSAHVRTLPDLFS